MKIVKIDVRWKVAAAACAALVASAPALAQQGKGEAKAEAKGGPNVAQCAGCHGIPGYRTAFPSVYHVPLIAGQNPAYIVAALKAYRSGERSHGSMRGVAASLSDQEMEQLAAYYGGAAK